MNRGSDLEFLVQKKFGMAEGKLFPFHLFLRDPCIHPMNIADNLLIVSYYCIYFSKKINFPCLVIQVKNNKMNIYLFKW